MKYFTREVVGQVDDEFLPRRVWSNLRLKRTQRRYDRDLGKVHETLPPGLRGVVHAPLKDAAIIGVRSAGDCLWIDLYASTFAQVPLERTLQCERAHLLSRPPLGAWVLAQEVELLAAGRFRFAALCSRGSLVVELGDARFVADWHDSMRTSRVA